MVHCDSSHSSNALISSIYIPSNHISMQQHNTNITKVKQLVNANWKFYDESPSDLEYHQCKWLTVMRMAGCW